MSTLINIDPICGMVVEPGATIVSYTYAGCTYLFCCPECRDVFQKAASTCVAYLAHNRSLHVGHLCQYRRDFWRPDEKAVFR